VVGAGIVGLAHAFVAARKGLRVAVVERDHRCVGASVRNFGFVTVTGQGAGDTWRRAMRSRAIWEEIALPAGIPIEHRGMWLLARRPLAMDVLEAFRATAMGADCELLTPAETARRAPFLRMEAAVGALYSPHELRVESSRAIPALGAWLTERFGVQFFFGEEVVGVSDGQVHTPFRSLKAERTVLCPGTELNGVAAPFLRALNLQLSRLQMLRVRVQPGLKLAGGVMSDLSLVRYLGYAALPQAAPLLAQLQEEEAESLSHGIHLIAVQSEDGTLVVGDSHHNFPTPEPYASEAVDTLILRHLREALRVDRVQVLERWTGVYPTGASADCVTVAPDTRTRVVVVTSGTGASTAFGIAEETFSHW